MTGQRRGLGLPPYRTQVSDIGPKTGPRSPRFEPCPSRTRPGSSGARERPKDREPPGDAAKLLPGGHVNHLTRRPEDSTPPLWSRRQDRSPLGGHRRGPRRVPFEAEEGFRPRQVRPHARLPRCRSSGNGLRTHVPHAIAEARIAA